MDKERLQKSVKMLTGDFVHGKKFEEAVCEMVDYVNFCQEEKERYRAQLAEYNKDEEIQKLKSRIEKMSANSLMIMSDKEAAADKAFREAHYKKCKNGNSYQYTLTGTGIGVCIEITCPVCKKKKDITDTSSW